MNTKKAKKSRIKASHIMTPLGPEDFPPGSSLRDPSWPSGRWVMVVAVGLECIHVAIYKSVQPTGFCFSFRELMEKGVQIKRPGEDWTPCQKEAVQP